MAGVGAPPTRRIALLAIATPEGSYIIVDSANPGPVTSSSFAAEPLLTPRRGRAMGVGC